MITLIKNMPKIKCENAAYAKISAAAAAYIEYEKIALFWSQTNASGKITALFSLIDGIMNIANFGGDTDEISEFTKCIAPRGIFTDLKTAEILNLKPHTECESFIIYPPYDFTDSAENTYAGVDFAIKTVASRLDIGNTDAFKADILHRINHNCCGYVSTPYSAAFLLYSDDIAILSGIAVTEGSGKKGLGASTLHRLCEMARHRPMMACCEDKNTGFYLKCGFKKSERFAYCK